MSKKVSAVCKSKRIYDSQLVAKKYAGKAKRKYGVVLHPYRCDCGNYHLSSKPTKAYKGEQRRYRKLHMYHVWINYNVPQMPSEQADRSEEFVPLMAAAFPELKIVKGVIKSKSGCYQHTWLVTPKEEVIDPTARQFHLLGELEYKPAVAD
jgi:hypothetical protein